MYTRDILIDIDSLMDTRLGLAKELVPDLDAVLNMDVYRSRITDVWASVVGIEDWTRAWRSRGVWALRNARPTRLFHEIVDVIEREHVSMMLGAPIAKPTITIRISPYDISGEEESILKEAMVNWFMGYEVSLVKVDLEDLNPKFLNNNWDAWFTYDWLHWLEVHASKLENPIPNFVIYCPALLSMEHANPQALAALKKDALDPFETAKKFMSPYITMEALDVVLFSLADVVEG